MHISPKSLNLHISTWSLNWVPQLGLQLGPSTGPGGVGRWSGGGGGPYDFSDNPGAKFPFFGFDFGDLGTQDFV